MDQSVGRFRLLKPEDSLMTAPPFIQVHNYPTRVVFPATDSLCYAGEQDRCLDGELVT